MKVFQTLELAVRQNLQVLFSAGFLFWVSLASLLPTMPLYIQSVGGNSQQIGLVMGCFSIGLLVSRGYLAKLADFRGRKIVLLIGMAAVAIAPIGYALTASIPLLMVIRAFHGLSIAAFALAYSALVVDLSPPQQRGELIGYMSLVNPIGMGLGPALGGTVHQWAGYGWAFATAAVVGGVGILFTARVQESHLHNEIGDRSSKQPFWRMLGYPKIRIPALVLMLIGFSFGTLVTFVPLLMLEVGVSLNVGLFYSAAAIASFGIRLLVGRASDVYGRGLFITISLILYTLAMVLLWRASSALGFLIAGFLEGGGAGILIPMMAALMADRSHADERGRTFSLCMVGFDLGIALAGPVLGWLALYLGYKTVFGLSAGLSFLALAVFVTLSGRNLSNSWKFALGRDKDVYAVEPGQ